MDGQPDGIRACSRDPMAPSGRDQQPVAGGQSLAFAIVELQFGAALSQHHPLVVGLLIPEARWAGVAVGYDAFDAQAGPAQQGLEVFFRADGWERGEKVVARQGAWRAGWERGGKKAAPG